MKRFIFKLISFVTVFCFIFSNFTLLPQVYAQPIKNLRTMEPTETGVGGAIVGEVKAAAPVSYGRRPAKDVGRRNTTVGPDPSSRTYGPNRRGLFGKRAPVPQTAEPTLSEVVQPYFDSQKTARELLTSKQLGNVQFYSLEDLRYFESFIQEIIGRIDDPKNDTVTFKGQSVAALFGGIPRPELAALAAAVEFLDKKFPQPKESEHPREVRQKAEERIKLLRETLVNALSALQASGYGDTRDAFGSPAIVATKIKDLVRDYYQAQDIARDLLTSKELGSMRLRAESLNRFRDSISSAIRLGEAAKILTVRALFASDIEEPIRKATVVFLEKEFTNSELTRMYYRENDVNATDQRYAKLRAVLVALTNALPAASIAPAQSPARGSNNGYITYTQHKKLVNPYIEAQFKLASPSISAVSEPADLQGRSERVIKLAYLEELLSADRDGIKIYTVEGLFDATGVVDHWGITTRAVYVDKHILENLTLEEQTKYASHPFDELRATLALGRGKGIDGAELARRLDSGIRIKDKIDNETLLLSIHEKATSFPGKIAAYVINSPLNNATNLSAAIRLRDLLQFVVENEIPGVANGYFIKEEFKRILLGMGVGPAEIKEIINMVDALYIKLVNNEEVINERASTYYYSYLHAAIVARLTNFIDYYNQRMQTISPPDTTPAVRGAGAAAAEDAKPAPRRLNPQLIAEYRAASQRVLDRLAAIYEQDGPNRDDYYVKPMVAKDSQGRPIGPLQNTRRIILGNHRGDRMMELVLATQDPDFNAAGNRFDVDPNLRIAITPFANYDSTLFTKFGIQAAFPYQNPKFTTLSDVLLANDVIQIRVAESDKGAHVTEFFDGRRSLPYEQLEKEGKIYTVIIPSEGKDDKDKAPEMKFRECAEAVLRILNLPEVKNSGKRVFVFCNLATDIQGHNFNGRKENARRAVLATDEAVGIMRQAAQQLDGAFMVTSDHGNIEEMAVLDEDGKPLTDKDGVIFSKQHTVANPVPFVVEGLGDVKLKEGGNIANIAATAADALGINPSPQWQESLLVRDKSEKGKKAVFVIVRDGWGIRTGKSANPAADEWDAVKLANPPVDADLMARPHTLLKAHGEVVGLPDDQMGDSDTGHVTIGAGQIVPTVYKEIIDQYNDGRFYQNPVLLAEFQRQMEEGEIHLGQMISRGGVHSDDRYIFAQLEMAKRLKVDEKGIPIFIHAILDGRDVQTRIPDQSGLHYLQEIFSYAEKIGLNNVFLADTQGRQYIMDRDARKRESAIAKEKRKLEKAEGPAEQEKITKKIAEMQAEATMIWKTRFEPGYNALVYGIEPGEQKPQPTGQRTVGGLASDRPEGHGLASYGQSHSLEATAPAPSGAGQAPATDDNGTPTGEKAIEAAAIAHWREELRKSEPTSAATAPVAPAASNVISLPDILAEFNKDGVYGMYATNALAGLKGKKIQLVISPTVLGPIELNKLNELVQAMRKAGFDLAISSRGAIEREETDIYRVYLISEQDIDTFHRYSKDDKVLAIKPLTDNSQILVLHRAILAGLGLINLTPEEAKAENSKAQAVLEMYNSLNPAPDKLDFKGLSKLVDPNTDLYSLLELLKQIVGNLPMPKPQADESISQAFKAILTAVGNI